MQRSGDRLTQTGFTLLETLLVIIMVGVLSSIAAVSWLALIDRQRLTMTQDRALQVMREAQANAKRTQRVWEACIRETGDRVQASVHARPWGSSQTCATDRWETIAPSPAIDLDTDNSTLYNKNGVYRIQFQPRGTVNGRLGRIVFTIGNRGDEAPKRCIFVSTLLGALNRRADEKCER